MIFLDAGPGMAVTTLGFVGSSGKKAEDVTASLIGDATLAKYRTRDPVDHRVVIFLRKIAGIIIDQSRENEFFENERRRYVKKVDQHSNIYMLCFSWEFTHTSLY